LTYSELGDRLGSSPEAARSLARRLRLLRKPGNDGKVRVIVDLAEIHYKPVPARSPDGPQADNSALNAQIEQLQAELARLEVEKNCLEARVAGHRSDFERERDRCDKLLAETLVLTKVAMSARENAARLEGEVSARRGRRRWGQFFAPRRANAQRPAETSVTASPLPARIWTEKPICKHGNAEFVMLASRVNDSKDLRERAAEMRASSKELKDNNTATVILRLAELYDRLAERAESRSNGGVPPSPTA
jgi:hypothetical protein